MFNLDPQLLHDAVLLAIAVFVMFLFLSYMLFNPAREMLKKRQDKVKDEIDSAEKSKEDAAKLKEEYENRLREIHKEEDAILGAARKKALDNEAKIIEDAKAEAANIIARANKQAELEMKKAQDEIKKEIISVAALVAEKVVSDKIDIEIQDPPGDSAGAEAFGDRGCFQGTGFRRPHRFFENCGSKGKIQRVTRYFCILYCKGEGIQKDRNCGGNVCGSA